MDMINNIFFGISSVMTFLGYIFGTITFIYLIYNHFKKSIELTEDVQSFYSDIGNLIFFFYKNQIMKKLYEGGDNKILEMYFNSEMMHIRYKGRFNQKYERFSEYLGLIYITYRRRKYFLSSRWKSGLENSYINKEGKFHEFYSEPVPEKKDLEIEKRKSFYDEKQREYKLDEGSKKIKFFLSSLKFYWENYFNKRNRPWKRLKPLDIPFSELNYDIDEVKFAEGIWDESPINIWKEGIKVIISIIILFIIGLPVIFLIADFLSFLSDFFSFFSELYTHEIFQLIIIFLLWVISPICLLVDFYSEFKKKSNLTRKEFIKFINSSRTHDMLLELIKKYPIKYIKDQKKYEEAKLAVQKAWDICVDYKSSLMEAKESVKKYADFF